MKRYLAAVLAIACLGQLSPQAAAQSTVSGSISSNTTWTVEDSPYLLSGIVTVEREATLSVEPGVSVLGREGAGLSIEGTLVAEGTEESPITMGVEGENGSWEGLRFPGFDRDTYPWPEESVLRWITISHARVGLDINERLPAIEHAVLDENHEGLRIENPPGVLTVTDSRFTNHTMVAISGHTRETVHLAGNDFWNNVVNLETDPQPVYDCGPDNGLWDIHGNDILLGPVNERAHFYEPEGDYTYRPYDVRTPIGSNVSPYVVSATDNWWGSANEQDVAARFDDGGCCPSPPRKDPYWQPISIEPHTPWEPDGRVFTAFTDGFHGDPAYIEYVTEPQHGSCLRTARFRRIAGMNQGALGKAARPQVGVGRVTRDGCAWWRPRAARFVPASCDDPPTFKPDATREDHRFEWEFVFPRALKPGRYIAFSSTNGYRYAVPGRNKVMFRIQRSY